MFICGRGFVWSRRDPDADADKLNSIHSKLSNSIFQASPLVLAALHFNLNIAQILDFNFELDNFRKKFCEENLNAVLSEKFTKVSNVIKSGKLGLKWFAQIFGQRIFEQASRLQYQVRIVDG